MAKICGCRGYCVCSKDESYPNTGWDTSKITNEMEEVDWVNSPPHYQLDCGVEVIDIIKSIQSLEAYKGYLEGNVIKYLLRAREKNGQEDRKKAFWYLSKLVEEN